jgi:hypothetical protein
VFIFRHIALWDILRSLRRASRGGQKFFDRYENFPLVLIDWGIDAVARFFIHFPWRGWIVHHNDLKAIPILRKN